MNPFEYVPRATQFHGVVAASGRQLKLYSLAVAEQAGRALPTAARLTALLDAVFSDDTYPNDHALGFVILHFAADGDYLLVSTWCDANMLRQRVYAVDAASLALTSLQPTHIVACVWELAVIQHERNSWIGHVLKHGALSATNQQAYLAAAYEDYA